MNRARRKQIDAIRERLADALGTIATIRGDLESIRDEEQDYRDAMPDSIAEGPKGDKADEAITYLEEVISALEDFESTDVLENLEAAQGERAVA